MFDGWELNGINVFPGLEDHHLHLSLGKMAALASSGVTPARRSMENTGRLPSDCSNASRRLPCEARQCEL